MDKENQLQVLTPMTLLDKALDKDLDIEKLERFFALVKEWNAKESEKAFYDSLAEFQFKIPKIEKKSKAYHGSPYADLATIIEKIKTPLQEHGFSIQWGLGQSDGKINITSILSHVGGHQTRTTMVAAADGSGSKNSIQAIGSTQTYLQRYTLIANLGLTTADTDDDGGKKEPDKKAKKENFLPGHARWKGAIEKLESGELTIETIEETFSLTKENREILCRFQK